jgi:hypothetical protein
VKRTSLSFILAYVALVILPILGLSGALRIGRTLIAPVSISGVWKIHVNPKNTVALPCGKSLAAADAGFAISQSGRNFTLQFNNPVMSAASGHIEGNTIKADIAVAPNPSGESGCDEAHVLSFTATVDPEVNPQLLTGVLSVNDCSGCLPLEFRAVREGAISVREGS